MKQIQKSNFTLVELLAAMGIFAIIMLIVFQMLASSQDVWSLTQTNTRIYENARIALDVITRDLQCAIASNRHDGEIPFYTGNTLTGYDTNIRLAFVSARVHTDDCQSALSEIVYTLYTGAGASYADDRYWFRRSQMGDQNDDPANENHAWDFYGDTSDAWIDTARTVGADTDNGTNFQRVINGVEDLYFVCYDDTGATYAEDAVITELPASVYVSITLFDPKLSDVWGNLPPAKQNQSRRTFTKMIYLKTDSL